jgi:hypothetical protein
MSDATIVSTLACSIEKRVSGQNRYSHYKRCEIAGILHREKASLHEAAVVSLVDRRFQKIGCAAPEDRVYLPDLQASMELLVRQCLCSPLGREFLVGERFDKDASHHAPGLKPNLLASLCIIPIG